MKMKNHFINNIHIENFKCFQNLQIEGIETVMVIQEESDEIKDIIPTTKLYIQSKTKILISFGLIPINGLIVVAKKNKNQLAGNFLS